MKFWQVDSVSKDIMKKVYFVTMSNLNLKKVKRSSYCDGRDK